MYSQKHKQQQQHLVLMRPHRRVHKLRAVQSPLHPHRTTSFHGSVAMPSYTSKWLLLLLLFHPSVAIWLLGYTSAHHPPPPPLTSSCYSSCRRGVVHNNNCGGGHSRERSMAVLLRLISEEINRQSCRPQHRRHRYIHGMLLLMWLLLLLERTEGSLPLGRRQINLNINYLLAANNTYNNGLDVGGQRRRRLVVVNGFAFLHCL